MLAGSNGTARRSTTADILPPLGPKPVPSPQCDPVTAQVIEDLWEALVKSHRALEKVVRQYGVHRDGKPF